MDPLDSEFFSYMEKWLKTAVLFWCVSGGTTLGNLSPTPNLFNFHDHWYLTRCFFLANSTEISTKSSSLLVQFCWKFPLNEPVIVASFPSSVNISSHYLFRILEFFLLRIWSLVIFCHNFILLWTALNFSWCFVNPIFPTLLLNSTW